MIDTMKKAGYLYLLEAAQTSSPIYGSKRFALLRDAGYAPSLVRTRHYAGVRRCIHSSRLPLHLQRCIRHDE